MTDTKERDVLADEMVKEVLSLVDYEEQIESLRRVLYLSVGVSAGLILALHLVLRREV